MNKNKMIIYEIIGFALILVFIWINELLDLPHVIFNTPPTPVNIAESVIESIAVLLVAIFTVVISNRLLKRIKHLESFLRICCVCKKIYDNNRKEWVALEDYFSHNSHVEFTHGFCPECSKKFE